MQTMPNTTSRWPRTARVAGLIALVAALVAASSCGDAVREGTGSTFLVIADELGVGLATIRSHVSNLLHKLHFENRTQLALYAREQGMK